MTYLAYIESPIGRLYWIGVRPLQLTTDRKYAVQFNTTDLLRQVVPDQFLVESNNVQI